MAYILNTQKILDTRKRLVIKILGSGSNDDPGNLIVNAATLNGYLQPGPGLYLRYVNYDINSANTGYVKLYWFGTNANSNIIFLSKQGMIPDIGQDILLPNDANGATGDVWVSTTGFSGNSSFTLLLDFIKDAKYFNPGYDLDPAAFNRGTSAPNGQNVN